MEKKTINKKWLIGGAVYAVAFLLVITVANITTINTWLGYIFRILRPVIIGLAIAYILNPLFIIFERKIFSRLNPSSLRRFISLLLSYVTMIVFTALLFWMILPQLFESTLSLLKNYEGYISSATGYINGWITGINGFLEQLTGTSDIFGYVNTPILLEAITNLFSSVSLGSDGLNLMDLISSENVLYVADILSNAVAVIADLVLGLFISLYFLASKEKRAAQVMRVRQALLNDKINGRLSLLIQCFDKSFGSFIKGKALDSIIIGILLYILFSIFQIPFALVAATFIAVFNIIPMFGFLVGVIPTALIVFLSDAGKLIPFLIIAILIQQIDTNIICPKILGNNTGVSSLCVIIAISTMGSLWGFTGMLLGVPLFAAILTLSDYYLEKNLRKKGLPSEIESYYPGDALVDPVKDSHLKTEKLLKRLEKTVLSIYHKQDANPDYKLTRRERSAMWLYRVFKKYNILSDFQDESIIQFCADQEQATAYKRAKMRFHEIKKESDASAPPSTPKAKQ